MIALFIWMAGSWTGTGEKFYPVTGEKVALNATVHSSVVNGRLISSNRIVEAAKTYDRVYCLRPRADQDPANPVVFVFFAGDCSTDDGTDAHAAATGTLNGRVLTVEQKFGPEFVVRSRTEFSEDGTSTYNETSGTSASTTMTTTIHYVPASSQAITSSIDSASPL